MFFIILSRHYHGEQIHANKLDRSSRIHYKEINTYKIVVKKLEKTGLSWDGDIKIDFKVAVYKNMERMRVKSAIEEPDC
jgi:hypothetical protein